MLTPPDVISQLLLAFPLWLLYELGIIAARMIGKPAAVAETDAATDVATKQD